MRSEANMQTPPTSRKHPLSPQRKYELEDSRRHCSRRNSPAGSDSFPKGSRILYLQENDWLAGSVSASNPACGTVDLNLSGHHIYGLRTHNSHGSVTAKLKMDDRPSRRSPPLGLRVQRTSWAEEKMDLLYNLELTMRANQRQKRMLWGVKMEQRARFRKGAARRLVLYVCRQAVAQWRASHAWVRLIAGVTRRWFLEVVRKRASSPSRGELLRLLKLAEQCTMEALALLESQEDLSDPDGLPLELTIDGRNKDLIMSAMKGPDNHRTLARIKKAASQAPADQLRILTALSNLAGSVGGLAHYPFLQYTRAHARGNTSDPKRGRGITFSTSAQESRDIVAVGPVLSFLEEVVSLDTDARIDRFSKSRALHLALLRKARLNRHSSPELRNLTEQLQEGGLSNTTVNHLAKTTGLLTSYQATAESMATHALDRKLEPRELPRSTVAVVDCDDNFGTKAKQNYLQGIIRGTRAVLANKDASDQLAKLNREERPMRDTGIETPADLGSGDMGDDWQRISAQELSRAISKEQSTIQTANLQVSEGMREKIKSIRIQRKRRNPMESRNFYYSLSTDGDGIDLHRQGGSSSSCRRQWAQSPSASATTTAEGVGPLWLPSKGGLERGGRQSYVIGKPRWEEGAYNNNEQVRIALENSSANKGAATRSGLTIREAQSFDGAPAIARSRSLRRAAHAYAKGVQAKAGGVTTEVETALGLYSRAITCW